MFAFSAIPFNFVFRLEKDEQSSLFLQSGPYLAISLTENNPEPYDIGFNFGLGYEFKNYQISLNYALGFTEVVSTSKNRVFSINVAGYFEMNKKEVELYQ